MKLFIIIILINIIKYCYSNQYIFITPYSNSCNGNIVDGVGYQLPINQCVTMGVNIINNAYLTLSNNQLTVTWLNNCSLPLDFEGSTKHVYEINSCTTFKVPYDNSYISTISTTQSTIQNNAVVFNYYYQQIKSCSGSIYKLYITNGAAYQGVQYTCKNHQPKGYTCDGDGQCYTYSINSNSCYDNKLYPYPFIVSC